MKKAVSICLVLLLLLSCAGAMAETMQVINCQYWVSLRSEPSTSSPRITTVPLGALVDAMFYIGQFIYCDYQGLQGYILAANLGFISPVYDYGYDNGYGYDDSWSEGNYLTVINCKDYVTLRGYASTSAPALTTVPLGMKVIAYEQVGDFTRCTYNGLTGYILSQYLGTSNTRRIINCKSYVTLRSYASTSAPSLAHVPLNATVVYIGYAGNGFAQCSYNGKEGYILEQYLGS